MIPDAAVDAVMEAAYKLVRRAEAEAKPGRRAMMAHWQEHIDLDAAVRAAVEQYGEARALEGQIAAVHRAWQSPEGLLMLELAAIEDEAQAELERQRGARDG